MTGDVWGDFTLHGWKYSKLETMREATAFTIGSQCFIGGIYTTVNSVDIPYSFYIWYRIDFIGHILFILYLFTCSWWFNLMWLLGQNSWFTGQLSCLSVGFAYLTNNFSFIIETMHKIKIFWEHFGFACLQWKMEGCQCRLSNSALQNIFFLVFWRKLKVTWGWISNKKMLFFLNNTCVAFHICCRLIQDHNSH